MPIEPVGPVVVGVDGSAESFEALDLAAEEAAGRVTPLVVVHAYPGHRHVAEAACAPEWVQAWDAPRRLLATAVARVGAEHPGLAVDGELLSGDPAETLIRRSAEACLVVVGHRRGGLRHGVPLGWVAPRVAALAASPVLVHRPLGAGAVARSPRPVLVAVDGPVGSDPLVEFAFAEADLRGAPLTALYVWPQPPGAEPAGIHPETYSYDDARDEAERMLAEALAGWSGKYPDVEIHREVRHSLDVVRTVRDASASAQLVVVGRCRHRRLTRMLLGSVSHAMVQGAGCPVAVIP
ncbi:MAG TPA: universal stress protein [Micromonosporaceae bacterium]|nr:universal stress protein [Micromonosporaceae bacterium]